MNIVLFGYRGSGKSTIGRMLAERLGRAFFDTDDEACDRLNAATIAEAWNAHGEPAWRKTECEVVADLVRSDGQVISLGGGTLMQEPARQVIARSPRCLRFYLECDPNELFRRTQSDPKFSRTRPNRPELGGSVDRVRLLLAERGPIYRAVADHVIDVTAITPEQAVQQILALLD